MASAYRNGDWVRFDDLVQTARARGLYSQTVRGLAWFADLVLCHSRFMREELQRRPSDGEAKALLDLINRGGAAPPPVNPNAIAAAGNPLLTSNQPLIPMERIKRNYDESSYRQLSVELQNAIDESIGKAKPSAQASLHLERARELLANGAASEAENQFRESLSQEPAAPGALAGLAHALLLQNKFPEARRQASASLDLQPGAEAYLVLARADLHDHDRAGAGQNLQKALALEPASEDAKAVAQEIQHQPADESPPPR